MATSAHCYLNLKAKVNFDAGCKAMWRTWSDSNAEPVPKAKDSHSDLEYHCLTQFDYFLPGDTAEPPTCLGVDRTTLAWSDTLFPQMGRGRFYTGCS